VKRVLAVAWVTLALSAAFAADPAPSPGETTAVERELAAVRDQLVALDIEKALYALNAMLERADLSESTRVEALDLRAQAYVASDDLDAAEKDYRALLELRPRYAPSGEVTSKKAMDRFGKIQASMIGSARIDLDPKDASITVDGRSAAVSADGVLPAVSGVRRLRFARKGFDAQEVDVQVVAGQATPVTIRLVPNARSLVVRTDVDGVAVSMDGVAAGLTSRAVDAGSDANAPATLVIEDVAIGEHELRFAKLCFATESLQEVVSVDLTDRSPKLARVVAMRPARTRVTATGATYDGELRVDGERVASLPLSSFEMCPGLRSIEVVASGRVVWSGNLAAEESDVTLDLSPRPNAVLVGATWPTAWVVATAAWSLRGRVDAPAAANLTTLGGWESVSLPPGTDLAAAVIPGAGVAGDERIVMYGPALHEVEDRASPPRPSRPSWMVPAVGAIVVDAGPGSVVFTSTVPSGPAARAGLLPGDRVITIADKPVASAAAARSAIAASGPGAKLVFDIASPGGTARRVECETIAEPRLAPPSGDDESRVVRAAWASVVAASGGPEAAPALANLAILLEGAGRDQAALDAWRRVRAIGGGPLAARAAYALGQALEASGKRANAIEAFGQTKSEGLANADPALAAAAADRLADLGVAPR